MTGGNQVRTSSPNVDHCDIPASKEFKRICRWFARPFAVGPNNQQGINGTSLVSLDQTREIAAQADGLRTTDGSIGADGLKFPPSRPNSQRRSITQTTTYCTKRYVDISKRNNTYVDCSSVRCRNTEFRTDTKATTTDVLPRCCGGC